MYDSHVVVITTKHESESKFYLSYILIYINKCVEVQYVGFFYRW